MIYPNKKNDHCKNKSGRGVRKIIQSHDPSVFRLPVLHFQRTPTFFSGIQRCSCTITSDNDAYCCIGFVWSFLRPVNPIPIGFDVNYIIVAQKNQKEYIPGYFWLAFEFCFLYNMRRNHAERWQSGNAADC